MLRKASFLAGITACLALSVSGCLVEDPTENQREGIQYEKKSVNPLTGSYESVKCQSKSDNPTTFCGVKASTALTGNDTGSANAPYSHSWNTNCLGDRCSVVYVFAHYTLTEDLGPGQTLRVEAFDNPRFNGNPVASLEIAGFNASKPGSTDREEIYLAPGEYYFRAYITSKGDTPIPYTMEGMDPVGEKPIGILGALSGAERVLVRPQDSEGTTLHINIDQLFQKPQAEADTQAKLRLLIEVDPTVSVAKHRDLHIVLYKEADLETKPAYDFTLSSNELLVKDQENKTDFISQSLKPDAYYVYVYLDANSNGLIDDDEVGGFVLEDDKPVALKIENERTRNAKILLKPLSVEAAN